MSIDTIDLSELRDAAENDGTSTTTVYIGGIGWDVVLALVEAAEAAHEVAGAPFGQIAPRDFYRLRETLSRFDFPRPENGHAERDVRRL